MAVGDSQRLPAAVLREPYGWGNDLSLSRAEWRQGMLREPMGT